MDNIKDVAIKKLNERGVTIDDISAIVQDLQKGYQEVSLDKCKEMVLYIISKRETIYTILTGIAIDEAAEKGLFDSEINDLIAGDNGLYGLDEILALSIVNMNGSIALTNFGYLDKTKPGIVGKVDKQGKERVSCNTFLDDIICAIAASAASRMAHSKDI